MITKMTTTAARSFSGSPFVAAGVELAWRDRMPSTRPGAANAQGHPSALAPISTVRFTDVVPADLAGRGNYANTKQDRPPRGEPR